MSLRDVKNVMGGGRGVEKGTWGWEGRGSQILYTYIYIYVNICSRILPSPFGVILSFS